AGDTTMARRVAERRLHVLGGRRSSGVLGPLSWLIPHARESWCELAARSSTRVQAVIRLSMRRSPLHLSPCDRGSHSSSSRLLCGSQSPSPPEPRCGTFRGSREGRDSRARDTAGCHTSYAAP